MNGNMVFVSMVGTQAFGVLQPLMSLTEKFGPLFVILLPTKKTLPVAERLKSHIESRDLGAVEIVEIGRESEGENSVRAKLGELAGRVKLAGDRVCFNLDGGLNYLVAAAVLELESCKPYYIQSSLGRSFLCDSGEDAFYPLKLPEAVPVAEILDIQGVPFAFEENFNNEDLNSWLDKNEIGLPQNCLRNVRIDNFVFDYVWNPGNNRLNFLKDWRASGLSNEEHKERDRDFAHWSTDRSRCGQLYDKRVFALAYDKKSLQRLQENSNGQICPIDIKGVCQHREKGALSAADFLKNEFAARNPRVKEVKAEAGQPEKLEPMENNTLVVCMGTNLPATLTAIYSHKPDHVLLCWSPGNALVEEYAKRLQSNAARLGLKSVQLARLREEGAHCESILPRAREGARIMVNISPGTKGQCGMLARWAMRHGHEIWTLHNGRRSVAPIFGSPADTPLPPMDFPDLLVYFDILGREMNNQGIGMADLEEEKPWLDAMLEFMRRLSAAGKDIIQCFVNGYMKLGADSMKNKGNGKWRLELDGTRHEFIKQGDGKWFEKLCARALENAGATNVRLNMELKWKDGIKQEAGKKASLELDVAGIFEGHIVLISAKAYELKENESIPGLVALDKAIENVKSTASNMGRFALSLLASLGSPKKMAEDRVAFVGWEDICDPDKLRSHIKNLARQQSTTD